MPFNTHSGVRGYPRIRQAMYVPRWDETTGNESWRFQREWGKSECGAHIAYPGAWSVLCLPCLLHLEREGTEKDRIERVYRHKPQCYT